MAEETNAVTRAPREVSSVSFPYYDLDDSIEIARAMHGAGGVPLDRDQLGAAVGLSPSGGNFAVKVSAARMFGLIRTNQNRYELTELGFEILDTGRERAAKAQAFLNVELYKKVYETFKGRQLPPRPAGLEQAFVQLGVAVKQRDKARYTFDRSARSAGFFPTQAEDRLVAPVIGPSAAQPSDSSALDGGVPPELMAAPPLMPVRRGLNPFIEGLLDEIPEKGAAWPVEDQANWLQAAAQIFRVLYKADGEIVVTLKKAGA